jgi:hypothetical protein
MNYGEVKETFKSILNRRDITPSQVETFMEFAVHRIQRSLRIPAMERVVGILTDGTPYIEPFGDLLELVSIHTDNDAGRRKLIRVDLERAINMAAAPGIPTVYCRHNKVWIIGNCPPKHTRLIVNYYANVWPIVNDEDDNWLTVGAPDLLIYGALVRAADFFLDDRRELFESTFQQCLVDLTLMANQNELVNASLGPALLFD